MRYHVPEVRRMGNAELRLGREQRGRPAPRPGDEMTFEEAAFLDHDETPGELVAGRFVPVPKSTWRHGKIMVKTGILLELYAREHPGWSVAVGNPGTKLRHDPDTLRRPDVAVVRAERVPEGRGADGWLEGAPDLAVEIVGDSQTVSELVGKAAEYLVAGAKMVWVLQPEASSILVLTSNHARMLEPDALLDGGELLPGFSCRVRELFG
jgi:Uma2 family endonuclease